VTRRVIATLVCVMALHACAAPERIESPPEFGRLAHAPVENVIVVAPGVISGGQPHGDDAFDALADMGVRTIISVDGARPDVDAAGARGMRYVHLPIGYDSVPDERRLELARALRDLPGPVYMHCHHGVHRGPAAAAAGLATLGVLTPEAGERFLREAGTSSSYPGLYASVRGSAPAAPAAIDAVPADLPSVAEVGGFIEAMATVDRAYDHLELLAAVGWEAPPTHPDLVPATEAGILAGALRAAHDDDAYAAPDLDGAALADIEARLAVSIDLASRLEALLVEGDRAGASTLMPRIEADCKACHRLHRNVR